MQKLQGHAIFEALKGSNMTQAFKAQPQTLAQTLQVRERPEAHGGRGGGAIMRLNEIKIQGLQGLVLPEGHFQDSGSSESLSVFLDRGGRGAVLRGRELVENLVSGLGGCGSADGSTFVGMGGSGGGVSIGASGEGAAGSRSEHDEEMERERAHAQLRARLVADTLSMSLRCESESERERERESARARESERERERASERERAREREVSVWGSQ
jgi:hypothetical protein